MDLDELTRFMAAKQAELQEALRAKAKGLTLDSVTREIRLDDNSLRMYMRNDWSEGEDIRIHLEQHHYVAIIGRDNLILKTSGNDELTTFQGNGVQTFYADISSRMKELKKRDEEDVPF